MLFKGINSKEARKIFSTTSKEELKKLCFWYSENTAKCHLLSNWANIDVPTHPYVWDNAFNEFFDASFKDKTLREAQRTICKVLKVRAFKYSYCF